jgi:hypothetical protein
MCTTYFNILKTVHFSHMVHVYGWLFFIILRINRDFVPNSLNWLVFVVETRRVFCEIWTKFLNINYMNFRRQTFNNRSITSLHVTQFSELTVMDGASAPISNANYGRSLPIYPHYVGMYNVLT